MNVIFCGLLRDPKRFERSLVDMRQLQKEGVVGEIIWSTWEGRGEEIPGVRVIESEVPPVNIGHIWHQMKSLDVGLQNSSSDIILKTRTDVYIDPDFLRGLNIDSHKIWIPWYQRLHPFYMADECFYGRKENIETLVNYDARYDFIFKTPYGRSHVRRFAHPYLEIPAVLQYLTGKISAEEVMPVYYRILKHYYYVHPGGVKFRWWNGGNKKHEHLEFCCDMKPIKEYEST